MITNRQKCSLIYFITGSFFLASGYSLIFKISGKDSWIAMIIGAIISTFITYIINKNIFNHKNGYILKNTKEKIYKIILSFFFLTIVFINLLVARIFATSFFLNKTPGIFITIPFLALCLYNAKKGIKTISKAAEILIIFSLLLVIFNIFGITSEGTIENILPIFTIKKNKLILSTIYYIILTVIPQLLLFDIKVDKNVHLKSIIFVNVQLILIGFIVIFVLGPNFIKIYRFPEYVVLKKLEIFNFIENIHNIVGLIWFFNLYITSSVSLYNTLKILNEKVVYILSIIVIILIELLNKSFNYLTFIYKNIPLILLFSGILVIFVLIKKTAKAVN